MSVTEAAFAVQQGIETAIRAVLAADADGDGVAVEWGDPPPSWPREMVLILDTEFDLDTATMGTCRTRDETIRQQIAVLVHRQGDGAQKAAADRAYGLVSAIESYVRTTAPTLGVEGCLGCFITSGRSQGTTDAADRASGRWAEVDVTFTARVRVTN